MDGEESRLMCKGRSFHNLGAATEKEIVCNSLFSINRFIPAALQLTDMRKHRSPSEPSSLTPDDLKVFLLFVVSS